MAHHAPFGRELGEWGSPGWEAKVLGQGEKVAAWANGNRQKSGTWSSVWRSEPRGTKTLRPKGANKDLDGDLNSQRVAEDREPQVTITKGHKAVCVRECE